MMITKVTDTIEDFEPWGGAIPIWKDIRDDPKALSYINGILNDTYVPFTETELNDFLWFGAYDTLVDAEIWEEE